MAAYAQVRETMDCQEFWYCTNDIGTDIYKVISMNRLELYIGHSESQKGQHIILRMAQMFLTIGVAKFEPEQRDKTLQDDCFTIVSEYDAFQGYLFCKK